MALKQPRGRLEVCNTLIIILEVCASAVQSGDFGKDFVFAPLPNHETPAIGVLLQAVSDENTTVNICVREISLNVNVTLSPTTVPYDYPLPNSLIYQDVSGKINSAVVITSDNDIFVLTYNLEHANSDIFTVIPKGNLGQEYFIATMTFETNPNSGSGVISISASEEYAYLEIFLNSTVEFENNQFYAGDIIQYNLLPYETIQLLPWFINITGSRVLSNASLAVRAGCKCAEVPLNVYACDHIAEQLAPFTSWGKVFVIIPLASRTSGYFLQIIAGRDNTTVTYSGVTVKLDMGHYVTVDIQNQIMTTVTADKPISVMQYSTGLSRDREASGDPSMMRVVPVEQYVTMATFPVYDFSSAITAVRNNYLGITSRCEYIESITVRKDGTPFSPLWMDHYTVELSDGTRYCTRWTAVYNGTYNLKSQPIITDDGPEFYPRFSAAVYGTHRAESYFYRAASDDRSLTCLNYSSWDNIQEERNCVGISRLISEKVNPYQPSSFTCYVEGNPLPSETSVNLYRYAQGNYDATGITRRSSTVLGSERAVVFDVDNVYLEEYACNVGDVFISITDNTFVLPIIEGKPVILNTGSTTARLQWNAWTEGDDVGDPPLVGYDVFMSTDDNWMVALRVDQMTTLATVTDLNPETDYSFSIAAVREGPGGIGPLSPEARTTTLPESENNPGVPVGAVVGGVIGSLLIIVLLIAAVMIRRRNKPRGSGTEQPEEPPADKEGKSSAQYDNNAYDVVN